MKLTAREFTILVESMFTQLKQTCKEITNAESDGKRPLFTTGYIIREQTDLYYMLRDNVYKRDIKHANIPYFNDILLELENKYSK